MSFTGVAILCGLTATSALCREPESNLNQVLDLFSNLVEFKDVALSADGDRVAWSESVPEKGETADDRSVVKIATRTDLTWNARRVSACPETLCEERDLSWSPQANRLAFLSDAGKRHQLQLYVVDVRSGRTKKLTELSGTLADPRWSPDGKQIAFLFLEGEDAKGPLGPTPRDSGVVQQVIHERRIAVVDAAGGQPRMVSPRDLFVYEYDWAPSGMSFVATGAAGSGDDNWWVAELFTISLYVGKATSVYKPRLQLASPRWSPDGKKIAFIEGLMSDQGVTGGDIFLLPQSGEARNLTPELKASASSISWIDDDLIAFGEWVDGDTGISTLKPSNGAVRGLWTGPSHIGAVRRGGSFSLSKQGTTSAVVKQSFSKPPEVYVGPPGSWTQVSHSNGDIHGVYWGASTKVRWKVDDFEEQGWLLAPDLKPGTRYPMVVIVHGGPASASTPQFQSRGCALASQGYFVFLPNPRGSFGQGEKFTRANQKDFGYGDLRDILAGVEAAVQKLPIIDRDRVGLFGWSYGGYMAMWTGTQTNRFRAAVAGAGISNWQSYYGQNRIDQWMIPYFGASVYDDPAIYARSSPINFIKQTKTPTLILQGERDAEVPAPQAYEYWHALKVLGVPTQLVIYPDEGHHFRTPEHRRDLLKRMVGWFDRYLRPPPG